VSDPAVLDLDMLQTGHSGYPTLATTVNILEESLAHVPVMPVLVSEANYEGILESSREEVQRFLFWSCMLSGAAGHTAAPTACGRPGLTGTIWRRRTASWGNATWRGDEATGVRSVGNRQAPARTI
jgi:hypothetical protein